MENLGQAVLIMAVGMGGVFAFLTVQASLVKLLTALVPAEAVATSAPGRRATAPQGPAGGSEEIHIAVIQAAVTAYEADKGARKS